MSEENQTEVFNSSSNHEDSTDGLDAKYFEEEVDPQADRALQFLRTLFHKMQVNVEVHRTYPPIQPQAQEIPQEENFGIEELKFDIEGPDAIHILGKKGAILEAIQYLTSRVVHYPGEPHRHLCIDIEGYRAHHEEQLAQMARRLAQRAIQEGKVITFDPMNARDRRVVHMALRYTEGVRTESRGEPSSRRVQIIPIC
ncbi:protein jag [Pajaroellobacter abortibovis]|uniref:R3H domain-containing protein n=1 Tax=Pajaroellobacter abortibovis TaxID=1882918 RepID=A0A1L6MXZ8_9BACT|nr:R3H domain-containing nucleic acid-binding protein [Pajaroellobacter abortibovis]APS00473.1 hypothetical protein BCY86_07135 [Pajaroellobacter abortibovis]